MHVHIELLGHELYIGPPRSTPLELLAAHMAPVLTAILAGYMQRSADLEDTPTPYDPPLVTPAPNGA